MKTRHHYLVSEDPIRPGIGNDSTITNLLQDMQPAKINCED
jgi:hypothetical protein